MLIINDDYDDDYDDNYDDDNDDYCVKKKPMLTVMINGNRVMIIR